MKKYLMLLGGLVLGYFLISGIYTQIKKDKTHTRATRLECQKHLVTFERDYDDKKLKIAQNLIKTGNYDLISTIQKAKYSQSKLFNYISKEQTDKIFQNELKNYITEKKSGDKKLTLKYNIYENDIKDPHKKTKKSKLYAGFILLEVKDENDFIIYKVQTDFMNKQGKDINQSINCCVKSFMTY